MPVFSVTYALQGETTSKKASLKMRISNECSHYLEYLDNSWIVKFKGSANDLYDYLRKGMDSKDHVLVIPVLQQCQGWLPKEYWDKINSMFIEGIQYVK